VHYFPHLQIKKEDVKSFAGLRVLPRSEASAFKRSRDVLLIADDKKQVRVLSLMGGKLTTYRATAAKALAAVKPFLPVRNIRADTSTLPLKPVE
jgi:glycerol-3-phosphate dehydrogenase